MKHLIVADPRPAFLQDLSTRVVLEERDVLLDTAKTAEEALAFARQGSVLAVCDLLADETTANIMSRLPAGAAAYGYCTAAEGRFRFAEAGMPCLGMASKSGTLLDMLEQDAAPVISAASRPPERKQLQEQPRPEPPPAPPEPPRMMAAPAVSMREPALMPQAESFLTGAEKLSGIRDSRMVGEADRDIAMDMRAGREGGTKTVTVYAAKGGVGKTTIAANTAVCIALTSSGRKKLRACVVDCNIDFGDICTTLSLDPRGRSMVHWASDIRERVSRGEDPAAITYDRRDMEESWLQVMPDTGLYALIAPVVHEDSMDIGEAEMGVMMRSLREHGGFDYIVCDTGNNTRDSSVIALESADIVLLVATQDVTTANCNDAFLSTMKKIGFDADKIKLVINNIMPSKATGISVKDIEQSFDYACIARIRRDEEIVRSNNTGVPMVYNPDHDFTKQIRAIIRYITKNVIEEAPMTGPERKKKGLISGFAEMLARKAR